MNNIQYELELNRKETLIQQLKQKISDYSDIIQNLEKECLELKASVILLKNEKLNNQVDKTEIYEKELKQLREELSLKDKYCEDKLLELQKKHEKDISTLKNLYESIANKADVATANERLCDVQKNQLEIFKKEIMACNMLKQTEITSMQLAHELKFSDLKKKMLDQIRETQKKITQLNLENMDVSTKLILLQNHQLLIELEYQTMQIEELLKKKSALEKKVFELQKDIETHEHVENTLASKNKTLLDMIKKYNIDEKTNSPNVFTFDDNVALSKSNNKMKLKRMITRKNDEYEDLKINYDALVDKFHQYEIKYHNIFNLFEVGLARLSQDKEIKNLKNINVNIDALRNGDFSRFNNQQKYALLMILVKKLLPLIELNNNESQVKKNIRNVKFQFNKEYESIENKLEENMKFIETLPKIRTQTNFYKKF